MNVTVAKLAARSSVACRGLVIPGATAWLYTPAKTCIEQWPAVVIVTVYTLFVTSQYDLIFTFGNQRSGEVCCQKIRIILHAPSFLVVVQCVTVMNIIYPLQVRRPEQNTALNAKTEKFITAKISGNTLKQGSRAHSVLRHGSSQLQKYKSSHLNSGVKRNQWYDKYSIMLRECLV